MPRSGPRAVWQDTSTVIKLATASALALFRDGDNVRFLLGVLRYDVLDEGFVKYPNKEISIEQSSVSKVGPWTLFTKATTGSDGNLDFIRFAPVSQYYRVTLDETSLYAGSSSKVQRR